MTCILVAITTHDRHAMAIRTAKEASHQLTKLGVNFEVVVSNSSSIPLQFSESERIRVLSLGEHNFWSDSNRAILSYASRTFEWTHLALLNEDTLISPRFFETALELLSKEHSNAAVCGATVDSQGRDTYGGYVRSSEKFGLHLTRNPIDTKPKQVIAFNGNLVLVKRQFLDAIGGWPKGYSHLRADIVLGFRLSKVGNVVQLAGQQGRCEGNDVYKNVFESRLKIRDRIRMFGSSKGYPLAEHYSFTRELGGMLWFLYFVMPYLRLIWAVLVRTRF